MVEVLTFQSVQERGEVLAGGEGEEESQFCTHVRCQLRAWDCGHDQLTQLLSVT